MSIFRDASCQLNQGKAVDKRVSITPPQSSLNWAVGCPCSCAESSILCSVAEHCTVIYEAKRLIGLSYERSEAIRTH